MNSAQGFLLSLAQGGKLKSFNPILVSGGLSCQRFEVPGFVSHKYTNESDFYSPPIVNNLFLRLETRDSKNYKIAFYMIVKIRVKDSIRNLSSPISFQEFLEYLPHNIKSEFLNNIHLFSSDKVVDSYESTKQYCLKDVFKKQQS